MANILAGVCLTSAILTLATGASLIKNDAFLIQGGPENLDPEGKYILTSWTVNQEENLMIFEVEVATLGYVGFGISPDGGMNGADIFIGGVDSNLILYSRDNHGENHTPVEDAQADWNLLLAWEDGEKTRMTFTRKINTCDNEDYPITNGDVNVIWAIGESDDIERHAERGTKVLNLLEDYVPEDPCESSTEPPTSDPPTSDPPTSDPPTSDPATSDLPTSDPPTNGATSPITTTWNPPSSTCPPSRLVSSPKFSQTFYQSFLPSWPTAGTTVHLDIHASTEDNVPLQYELVSPFEYLTMSLSRELFFTQDVGENSYVGPNNVMIVEVIATTVGDESRSSTAAIVLVFPRITKGDEKRIEDGI